MAAILLRHPITTSLPPPIFLDDAASLDRVSICHHCDALAANFCKTCDTHFCKFCIVSHYKNKNFKKDHEMIST